MNPPPLSLSLPPSSPSPPPSTTTTFIGDTTTTITTTQIKKYYQPKRNKPTKYTRELSTKPFKIDCFCEICCKVFSRKYDRDRHYRIHLNKLPYSCKVCGAKFIRSDYVINHIRNTPCGQADYYQNKYKYSDGNIKKKRKEKQRGKII
ncbi:hypothetical protein PIROE2DRAFT_47399 [Piromyces sp. E2]|nr:hypothetical protein PIROE2DRAFT_47399 [Piromyces sp. E2]|eukprot:OUM59069.1 hypothetical protein PIROE2DRAFT_47399 [Piromyces sp. E2]